MPPRHWGASATLNSEEFIEEFEIDLQIEPGSVSPATKLEDLPEYDSMGRITVLSLVDALCDVQLTAEELESCATVGDIISFVEGHDSA